MVDPILWRNSNGLSEGPVLAESKTFVNARNRQSIAGVQRIRLIGDRGTQRDGREQPGNDRCLNHLVGPYFAAMVEVPIAFERDCWSLQMSRHEHADDDISALARTRLR